MDGGKTPVAVLKCGLVISKDMTFFAATPDRKVIDFGCSQSFGILEVECPSTKSAVTPLNACANPKFFCERVGDRCCLKTNHGYYAKVQGQMAIITSPGLRRRSLPRRASLPCKQIRWSCSFMLSAQYQNSS